MYTDNVQPHTRGGVHKSRGLMCIKSRRATGRIPVTAKRIGSTAVAPYHNILDYLPGLNVYTECPIYRGCLRQLFLTNPSIFYNQ